MSQKKYLLVLCCLFVAAMMIVSLGGCAKKAVSAGASGISPDKETVGEAKTAAQSGAAVTTGSDDAGGAVSTGDVRSVAAGSGAVRGLMTEYTVKKGESLWWIAKYKDVYDDAFLWPLIYKANKDQIKNPNLIYPGQKLKIPRSGISKDEITKARKQAGAKKPYTPPKDSKPPVN